MANQPGAGAHRPFLQEKSQREITGICERGQGSTRHSSAEPQLSPWRADFPWMDCSACHSDRPSSTAALGSPGFSPWQDEPVPCWPARVVAQGSLHADSPAQGSLHAEFTPVCSQAHCCCWGCCSRHHWLLVTSGI